LKSRLYVVKHSIDKMKSFLKDHSLDYLEKIERQIKYKDI